MHQYFVTGNALRKYQDKTGFDFNSMLINIAKKISIMYILYNKVLKYFLEKQVKSSQSTGQKKH